NRYKSPFDRGGHLFDRRHAVDACHQTTRLVAGQNGRGLGAVFRHARAHRLFVVVLAALELAAAALVADSRGCRLLKLVVVTCPTISAGEAPDNPPDEFVFIDFQLDYAIKLPVMAGENSIELPNLFRGARVAVEDSARPLPHRQ